MKNDDDWLHEAAAKAGIPFKNAKKLDELWKKRQFELGMDDDEFSEYTREFLRIAEQYRKEAKIFGLNLDTYIEMLICGGEA